MPSESHAQPGRVPFLLPAELSALGIQILSASLDCVFVNDRDGKFVFVNEAGARALNTTPEELEGWTFAQAAHLAPDAVPMFDRFHQEVLATAAPVVSTCVLPGVDGIRAHQFTLSPVTDHDGRVLATLMISREVSPPGAPPPAVPNDTSLSAPPASALKPTRPESRQEEEQRQYVMQAAKCQFWYADVVEDTATNLLEWTIHTSDEAAAQTFLPLDVREGETYKDARYRCRHPEDRAACDALGSASVRAGRSYSQDFRTTCADHTIRWLHEDIQVETVQEGKRWRLVAVCTDITERKRVEQALQEAERALRESETHFRFLADSIPHLVWSARSDGTIDYFNARCMQYTGLTADELGDWGWERVIHPDDLSLVQMRFRHAMETGEEFRHDCRTMRSDGVYRWHQGHALPLRKETGEIVRWYGTCTDVDPLKHMESALRASEHQLRTVVSNVPVILFAMNVEGVFTLSEGKGLTALGLSPGQVVGQSAFEVYRDHPDIQWNLRRALAGEIVHWLTDVNGMVFDALCTPLWDENGAVTGLIGIAVDTTERIQSERALRASEERLQAALTAGNMGVWEWRIQENRVTWSPEITRLFGMEHNQSVGNFDPFERYIHPEDRSRVHEAILKAIEDNSPFEQEYRIVHPDGGVRWIQDRGGVVYDSAGRPVRMIGTIADVTERKRLEEQVRTALKMESIGRLAGGIAHDFNNLLSVILGYAEMVEMELTEESELLGNVRSIQNAATRAAKLTSQLLAFARKQVSVARVIFPNEVITALRPILTPLIREDIELVMYLNEQAGSVRADPAQLEQILVNLIVNARDAMPSGGKILIQTDRVILEAPSLPGHSTVEPGQYVQIAVSDTGVGMTADVKARLFEPFFTTKGIGKGTGLGLATVYGIVKQSGGFIFVYSEVGIGTTVKVYLPVVPDSTEKPDQAPPGQPNRVGTETVLVAEDEALVRDLTARTLRRNGYTVLEANNGIEALRIASEYADPIHILVTDAIMPEMNGKQLAERLQVLRPSIQVLYVSGYPEEVTTVHGILTQGTAFLQKPFTAAGLLGRVREVLDSASPAGQGDGS